MRFLTPAGNLTVLEALGDLWTNGDLSAYSECLLSVAVASAPSLGASRGLYL